MCDLSLIGGALCLLVAAAVAGAGELRSEDAQARWTAQSLELETDAALSRFDLSNGCLRRVAWVNRRTGADLLAGPTPDFTLDVGGRKISSADPGWRIATPACVTLAHGEIEVKLVLEREGLKVTRHYVLHPGLSLLRGWLEIENSGPAPTVLRDPPISELSLRLAPRELKWMSGAECFGDSWKMRTEALGAKPREFDSFDPPPGASQALPGDGVDLRISLNDAPLWPATGWAHSAHANDVQTHDVAVQVKAGDRLLFVLNRHGNFGWDTTEWDPVVRYDTGEEFQASKGFSDRQGANGWSYRYRGDDGHWEDLVYDSAPGRYGERWRRKIGVIEPFVSATEMHPDPSGDAVRVFTAPRDGRVTVRGTARNTGNQPGPGRGFRMGSMAYAPWFCLMEPQTGEAAYLGFSCMGHWLASFAPAAEGGGMQARVSVGGFQKALAPGETVRTPDALCGLFSRDLDDMGQEFLQWQYRYLWDYTREPWFPGVRMLGYWYKGTMWGSHGWVGGDPDMQSAFRKVFRTADFMRQTGGDTYHRDWGWWDRAGDWHGPDFRTAGQYLRKYGMGMLIYAFIYTVDGESSVAKAHPDWVVGGTLDQSRREVIEYEVNLLADFYRRFGRFQWRNDSTPTVPYGADDTPLLAQQQGFMEVLRRFLDAHPDCAFQGVNGGGMALNWEYLAYASGFQFTDGQAQVHACYDATYLFPPDKINNMPDIWDPDKYDPATWRGLLCSNFDLTGDTFDPAKLEGLRDIIDVYHYLQARGVVGRWVRIYHPLLTGDDPTMYLQRLSWDHQRGIIITKHKIPGAVTVKPKGLLPEAQYEVGFHVDKHTFTRHGRELMEQGITLSDPAPGELIYLNLPDHPGNAVDKAAPAAPGNLVARPATDMGVWGVELTWDAAGDDRWLSHYVVSRDGEALERVAFGPGTGKTCFYFDHSAGADPAAEYQVRAVDGAGNVSGPAATAPSSLPRRLVLDDADTSHLAYVGAWERQTDAPQAHRGTLSSATAAGAGLSVSFHGRSVTWHTRLGAEGGLARVTVDGDAPAEVSCYSADEIPGWTAFTKTWPQVGDHVLRIEVLGQKAKYRAGTRVWVDAVSVGQ